MNKVTTTSALVGRKVLTLIIAAYLMAWGSGFIFVSREFGFVSAGELSLLAGLPLLLAARMRVRWPVVRGREFAFLLVLVTIVSGAVIGVVRNRYDVGMDRYHAEDLEYAAFSRTLRKDPAFLGVQLRVSPKHIFWIEGAVDSDADLARPRNAGEPVPCHPLE